MGVITTSIDDDVEKRLREAISDRKGAMGDAISEALRGWLEDRRSSELEERALERLEKGYEMGELQYDEREELHGRWEKN